MSSLVSFKTYGSGQTTLVCFPGWLHPLEKEPLFLKLLSKEFTVISVLLPGYMGTADADSLSDFPALAQDIHSFLKKIHSKKIVLVGFSLGCRLIMELEKQFPSAHPKIFVGCPIGSYQIPFWAKPLLSKSKIVNVLRKSSVIKKKIVTMALRKLSTRKAIFRDTSVSLTGAFDSLVALLLSKTDDSLFTQNALFIYGENDAYTQLAKVLSPKNIIFIKNAEHNCVRSNEKRVIKHMREFI